MKTLGAIILGGFLATATVYAGNTLINHNSRLNSSLHLSAYERVLQKGTLRCGYFEEAPFVLKDPNTGKMSGIAVELTEQLGKELGLKIDWVSEINFGTFPQDLASGRFDAVCADVFTLPRAGQVDYTTPFAMVPGLWLCPLW